MKTPWIHRCAVAVAVAALGLILSGAFITSSEGQPTASPLLPPPAAAVDLHRYAGDLVGLLAAGFCIWVILSERTAALRVTASVALLMWLAEVGLGHSTGGASPAVGVMHAFLAQLLLAATALLASLTSSAWQLSTDSPRGTALSFRWPARIIVVLLLLQVLLGDAYRHQTMGVISHILNAMIVALVVFAAGMVVTRKFSEPGILRSSAVVLMVVTGIQVMLGFAAFILLLMMRAIHISIILTSVAHVATGALTLAASVVFAMAAEQGGQTSKTEEPSQARASRAP
jgi:heme A synthase